MKTALAASFGLKTHVLTLCGQSLPGLERKHAAGPGKGTIGTT